RHTRSKRDWSSDVCSSDLLRDPRRERTMTFRIGIVDTTFSRVNMGQVAMEELRRRAKEADLRRVTVPGVKDLPAAARRFFDEGRSEERRVGKGAWLGSGRV